MPLSVLFADVRGYTKMTEGIDPAEVPLLMNRFYETASSALLSHEALLGQVEGDNVMGLFVPGLAGRSYQVKSIDGALELLRSIGYGTSGGPSLEVGIGVATGEEYVGNVGGGGYKDFTAIGDVTNTAARLTAQAAAGEVLVDRGSYSAVAERYAAAERRILELKGKSEPVEVFVLRVN